MGNSDVCVVINEFRGNEKSFKIDGTDYVDNGGLIELAMDRYRIEIANFNAILCEYGEKDRELLDDDIYSIKIYEI